RRSAPRRRLRWRTVRTVPPAELRLDAGDARGRHCLGPAGPPPRRAAAACALARSAGQPAGLGGNALAAALGRSRRSLLHLNAALQASASSTAASSGGNGALSRY